MEIHVARADPSDPMLTHEDRCVRVVEQVACQVRKLSDDLLGNLGVSLRGNKDAETGTEDAQPAAVGCI